ncbi:MAG: ATP-binding protein [Bacteroidota bacterium]|nr:ATP-binding protein [Bacteroidota bacterium]
MGQDTIYKKATKLEEIDNAVRFDVPVGPDHEFYTDFFDVRGDFEDKMIYRSLNVSKKFVFDSSINRGNKTLLFLAGMRGSGKTSELEKIAKKLNNKNCFFCITCNLDEGLDLNDMEYMDILIYQLERLFKQLQKADMELDEQIVGSLQKWFDERVAEVNKAIKNESGFEIEVSAGTPSLLSFLGITTKLKNNLQGSKENAQKIRTVFKNNFTDFAKKINEFFEWVNSVLRANGKAQELLFIVDGLEKTATLEIRKKIILEESNRIRQIKANTIFTLPIELMPETRRIEVNNNMVISFPFVKIRERSGVIVEDAVERFNEFVYKRIDQKLFDCADTVRKAILYSGGSPRELLRILQYAYMYSDDEAMVLDSAAINKAISKLAAQTAQYVSVKDLEKLKQLKEDNDAGKSIPYDEDCQILLEKLIIMEYNDGNYKRVNPIVEESQLYKQYVG